MKTKIKILLFFLFFFVSLLFNNYSRAASTYSDEGIKFYAQTSSFGYATEGTAFYANIVQVADTLPVYRFYNTKNGDHFYTTSEVEKNAVLNNPSLGYVNENIAFYAYSSQISGTTPVYRFYNSINGDHFYTISEDEKNVLINNPQWGYAFEDIKFYVFSSQIPDSYPVYRFFNSTTGDHFYTASEDEKNNISRAPIYRFFNSTTGDHFYTASESERSIVKNTNQSGYLPEGIAFYAYTNQLTDTLPVYRFYNTKNGDHFYTISEEEKNTINSNPSWGYVYEKIAFYAYASQLNNSSPIYRFYNSTTGDHFYTASESERYALIVGPLGPEIPVGLWYFNKYYNPKISNIPGIIDTPFQIDANKPYNVRNASGTILARVDGVSTTSISYNDSDNQLTVTAEEYHNDLASQTITFDAADGDNSNLIFNTHNSYYPNPNDWRKTLNLTHYRGKIKIQYYRGPDIFNGASIDSTNLITQFWIVNILPLEQYTWGAAETSGEGNINHTKVMTTAFRTFGFKRINYPKYTALGFRARSDSLDQTYGGYDWGEAKYPNVKKATEQTRGTIVTYANNAATTPYSSWSDGRTVASASYPWCKAKDDQFGNYNDRYWNWDHTDTKSHAELVAGGNHMVGLIAWGSWRMAKEGWDWQNILKYYYTDISLQVNY